jgi:hypothetical protein
MNSPRRKTRFRLASALLAGAISLGASTQEEFFQGYLKEHPEVAEEDLIEVAVGDSVDRVLAVIHHPDLGVDPLSVDLSRIDGAGVVPVEVPRVARETAAPGDLFIAVRQRCGEAVSGAAKPAFGSWLYLPEGGLKAWSLQPYGPDCRREDPLVEASDHVAMRRVGEVVFRSLRRGHFRYGPLAYQEWDDAFGAPSTLTMISRLKASVAARPDDAHAHNRLAVGLFAVGERDAAVEALQRAAELEPGWALPHRNLAVAHLHRGDLAASALARQTADEIERAAVGGGPPERR